MMIELWKNRLYGFFAAYFARPCTFLFLACICMWAHSTVCAEELSARDELIDSASIKVEIRELQIQEKITERYLTSDELIQARRSIAQFPDGAVLRRKNGETVIVSKDQNGNPKAFSVPPDICSWIPWLCKPAPPMP